ALRRSRLPALPTPFPYPTLFRSPPPLTSAPPSALPPPPWRGRPYPEGSGSREEAGPPPASRVSSARRSCGSSAGRRVVTRTVRRSEEHTSELQSRFDLVCRLMLE